MTRVCTICARAGSKGVRGKNIRPLLGRPLLAHTIEQARNSGLFDHIVFSSDSAAYRALARDAGADLAVERPAEMASDQAGKLPAIVHAVAAAEAAAGAPYAVVVDLDVTSPLRLPADITGAVALLDNSGAANVLTAAPARRSPYFNLIEVNSAGHVTLSKPPAQPILRRQDAPVCYDMNASIYVWRRDVLMTDPRIFYPDTRLFVMPEDRSVDIDSEVDFLLVELLMQRRAAA